MKKNRWTRLILATAFFTNITTGAFAQENDDSKTVKKGTVGIDAYYGFPNILVDGLKNELSHQYKYTVANLGPLGIRGEAFLADHVAFGLDVNYSAATISWMEERSGTYPNYVITYVKRDITFSRLRVLAKCNFHFAANDHFDWYAGGGFGYNRTEYTQHTDGVAAYYDPDSSIFTIFSQIPLSWRINFGGKYFFTKNIGLGFEAGISGGPLASVALCTKF